MNRTTRLGVVVGVGLLVLGSAGIASGGYLEFIDDCQSGYALDISSLDEDDPLWNSSDRVSFTSLSPVEQRIFLEAYTDERGISPTYEEWSSSWFDDGTVVEYRDERYRVNAVVLDCTATYGTFLIGGGIISILFGVGVLVQAGVWQLWGREKWR